MAKASRFERMMVSLINQERREAGLDPLRIDRDLNASSERHSEWMINRDIFSHTGGGGSSATDRIKAAGYDLTGSWRTGENIALQSERGSSGIWDDVRQLHQRLMNSPEHRANILNPNFDEIGIGIERGRFTSYDAVVVTQNFGRTSADNNRNASNRLELTAAASNSAGDGKGGDRTRIDDRADSFDFRSLADRSGDAGHAAVGRIMERHLIDAGMRAADAGKMAALLDGIADPAPASQAEYSHFF